MNISKTSLEGVYIVKELNFKDNRGIFIKNYNDTIFEDNGLEFMIKESFYSRSKKNVIRGMHFQTPPYDHDKLVTVISGSILDVIVDIRANSLTYGKIFKIELTENSNKSLFIKSGFAHGFMSLENNTVVLYQTNCGHHPDHDYGIRFDSFGFNWPINNPVVSAKDLNLPTLKDYYELNPFRTDDNE